MFIPKTKKSGKAGSGTAGKAKVECGKKTHTLDIRLVPKAKVGDYLLSENQFAVYKVSKEDALETLKLLNS